MDGDPVFACNFTAGSSRWSAQVKTKEKIRVEGYRATAQLEAQVEVPSIDFSCKSDPLSESQAKFAIIADELNGRYYASLK
jgi:hypothetical protein